VSKDGKLGFQPEQLSFGGAIELSLLGSGVASVAFGDVARDGKGGDDEGIGGRFGFAAGAVAHHAKDLTPEGNRFLPDFEIPEASSHVQTMAVRPAGSDTEPLPPGANARDQGIAALRGLRESPLVIFFTSPSSPRLLPVSGPPYGH
jgi:hypothetical protein